MCLCVCLSARICPEPHTRSLQRFLCMLPMSVAWSSSGIIGCIAYRREGGLGSTARAKCNLRLSCETFVMSLLKFPVILTIILCIYVIRGHTVKAVTESFKMSKDAGFKVVTHMMPDLPNVGLERDIEQFIVSVLLSKRVVLMFGSVVICILCIFALLILLQLRCILTVSKYNLPEVSLSHLSAGSSSVGQLLTLASRPQKALLCQLVGIIEICHPVNNPATGGIMLA